MNELGTPIDAVVLFDVSADELVRRISGRRTCSLCNKVFNIYTAPPASPATDCVEGSTEHQLFQRKDDEEATVKERLRVYEEKTRPVLTLLLERRAAAHRARRRRAGRHHGQIAGRARRFRGAGAEEGACPRRPLPAPASCAAPRPRRKAVSGPLAVRRERRRLRRRALARRCAPRPARASGRPRAVPSARFVHAAGSS